MPKNHRTMQAAILTELGQPLVIAEVALPPGLEFGQVLVKIYFSGVCGSQLGEIDGVKGVDNFLPHLLGHEGSGEVLDVGAGVKHVAPGDHVVIHWRKGAGLESPVPTYNWEGRRVNAGWVTTFNDLAVVSENRLTKIPPDFPLDIAPLFGCAVTTGMGVVMNNAGLKIGESIIVFGAGGVGLNVIQGAAMTSAYPIIAVDLFDNRLELAKACGATHSLNSKKVNVPDEIRKILGPQGADVAINNTASPEISELAYELTHSQGRIVLVGVPQKGHKASLFTLPLHFGKKLTGSHGGESLPQVDIPRYVKLVKAGLLKLDNLITARFPLTRINEAIGKMRSGEVAGRCLIEMTT